MYVDRGDENMPFSPERDVNRVDSTTTESSVGMPPRGVDPHGLSGHTTGGSETIPSGRPAALPQGRFSFLTQGLGVHKLTFIFTVGCVLGYIVEMIFCILWHGYVQTRQGMIYGPFSQIYGFGAVLMAIVLSSMTQRSNLYIFSSCALIGGFFEFFCSVFQEMAFGTKSWDFSDQTFHFGGRTSLLFMCLWGSLGLFFIRVVFPRMTMWMDRIPLRAGVVLSWLLIAFFTFNLFLSATAVKRWTEREHYVPAGNVYNEWLDNRFPDERMKALFPQMEPVERPVKSSPPHLVRR